VELATARSTLISPASSFEISKPSRTKFDDRRRRRRVADPTLELIKNIEAGLKKVNREVNIELTYTVEERSSTVQITLSVKGGASEGEILDAISRNTCESFLIAKSQVEKP
jgi:hypothetical protein